MSSLLICLLILFCSFEQWHNVFQKIRDDKNPKMAKVTVTVTI